MRAWRSICTVAKMIDPKAASVQTWLSIARSLQESATATGLGEIPDAAAVRIMEHYDAIILDDGIRSVSRELFHDGHYTQAVQEAYKFLDSFVREKIKSSETGVRLMRKAFSPEKPALRINNLQKAADKDEQHGYMDLLAGSMAAIRNPRSHKILQDDPNEALEMLALANHLVKRIKSAKRVRKPRRAASTAPDLA